ncbi:MULTISPECIES: hypothetical protein [Desulfococcus]|uniref:Uncharacterized protein n=1 Tax=Desulfococcus multivorans DSM 2059 TaxID=1121405 RepID=S7UKE4_DESML|nr:hypothetical protein [Desulfococcus multivorans]AOY56977.1 uncharacterized protein Dmul_02010 [Desulfococcus multivorans]AQU99497.1 hypothetical protein B2D07_01015 [Desulfococcus multivorans]EPR34299.1 hypothetical protein dsmv_3318 [Desulfococcus multivorans DSM 2059]SJZ90362.1 hypothetical protein SAMN02745446_02043 [Desulfococcus multivorans DSM 2059]
MKTPRYPLSFQKGKYAATDFMAKKEMAMKILMSFMLVLAVLMVPLGLSAQQEKAQPPADPAQVRTPLEHKQGMPKMSEMQMKECDEMMSRMKEMDARLDAKVADMDAAEGDQKVAAMAAVIKEMVSQRKEMQAHMMKMHDMRKGHMMDHMKPEMGNNADKE